MLNISSIDWGKSSESLKRERHHNKYLLNLCTAISGYNVVFQHKGWGDSTVNHPWRNGHRCYNSEPQSKVRRLAVLPVRNPVSTALAVTGMGWKKSLWVTTVLLGIVWNVSMSTCLNEKKRFRNMGGSKEFQNIMVLLERYDWMSILTMWDFDIFLNCYFPLLFISSTKEYLALTLYLPPYNVNGRIHSHCSLQD